MSIRARARRQQKSPRKLNKYAQQCAEVSRITCYLSGNPGNCRKPRNPRLLSDTQRLLAGRGEAERRPLADGRVEIPGVARKIDRCLVVILGERGAVGVSEALQLSRLAHDPARPFIGRRLEAHAELVFGLDAGGEHVELQG